MNMHVLKDKELRNRTKKILLNVEAFYEKYGEYLSKNTKKDLVEVITDLKKFI